MGFRPWYGAFRGPIHARTRPASQTDFLPIVSWKTNNTEARPITEPILWTRFLGFWTRLPSFPAIHETGKETKAPLPGSVPFQGHRALGVSISIHRSI